MNIGMILDNDFPPDPRVENEAVTLIKAGFKVSLFCYDYKGDAPSREEINGIQVYRKYCPKWVYKLSALAYTVPFYHWVTQKWIGQFIKEAAIDALHVHDLQIARAVFNLKSSKRMSVVLDLHEKRPEIMKFYNHLQKPPGKWLIHPKTWEKFEEKYIKAFDRTVVVTEDAKKHYVESWAIDPDKFIVLPNTIRKAFVKEAAIDESITQRFQDDFVMLYVGDTGLRRGLLTAIDACPVLLKSIPNLKLVIVGSNKSDDVLKRRVKTLGLEEIVVFEGWQDFTLFQSYIQTSDVCISPLHRNLHHDTTFANKIFQYMAMGKPVLVSDCPAQQNVVEKAKGGLIHEAEDVEDFTAQALKLYNDVSLRTELGQNGQAFVTEEFYWEKTSQSLVNYYQNLSTRNGI